MNFISAGAAQGLVNTVAAGEDVRVSGSFGAVGAMQDKFLAGDACDVVILTHAQIGDLAAAGLVRAETSADLGSVPTAIALREADSAVDVSSEAALRAALLAADAIYFPDPVKSTAGKHFEKVLQRLGIRGEVDARLRSFPNGATAMRELAAAKGSPIGCTQTTEIFATPGVRLVAPLPKGFDLETVYTAAVGIRATEPEAAEAFVDKLAGDAMRKARIDAGFRGYSIRRARRADENAVRKVVHGVLGEYGLQPDHAGTDADLDNLEASYFARGGHFEVAVGTDGEIAGCCGVFALDDATCELRKMYLFKEARGHGLGGRLLRRALAFARNRGFRRMELETASVLKDALALYAGAGFEPISRPLRADRCDQAFALNL